MSKPTDRALSKCLDELAAMFDGRTPWLFITKDRDGALATMSNQRPEQIRELAKEYLKPARIEADQ